MSRRGHTLIEVLIASTLYLLLLIVIGKLAVVGMRTTAVTEDKNQAFRTATICLDSLNRDLLDCSAVYLPPALDLGTEYHPGINPTPSLVLHCRDSVIGYRFSAARSEVTRTLYDPGFDPAVQATWKLLDPVKHPTKTMATWISDFNVRRLDPAGVYGATLLRSRLTVDTVEPGRPGPTQEIATDSGLRQ